MYLEGTMENPHRTKFLPTQSDADLNGLHRRRRLRDARGDGRGSGHGRERRGTGRK